MAGYTNAACPKCRTALDAAWKLPEKDQPETIIAGCGHIWTKAETFPSEIEPSDLKHSVAFVPESQENPTNQ